MADSAFSSVSTAALIHAFGLHFTGVVKTAHKFFPKAGLSARLRAADRGAHAGAVADVTPYRQLPSVELRAVAWKDSKVHHFVSTAGSTAAGPACKKRRYREEGDHVFTDTLEVPRPAIVERCHEGLSAWYGLPGATMTAAVMSQTTTARVGWHWRRTSTRTAGRCG
jgi:hypothetical protein